MIIEDYGSMHYLPDAAVQPDSDLDYKLLFDCRIEPDQSDGVNSGLNHAARLINIFGASGVPPSQMSLAAVLSGGAAKAALNNDEYRQRFGRDNPDRELMHELRALGVAIYVCGQSLIEKGYGLDTTDDSVAVASSALTVLANLQLEGYALMSY